MRFTCMAALSAVTICTSVQAAPDLGQTPIISSAEEAKVVEHFGQHAGDDVAAITKRHPDGVKGYMFSAESEPPVFTTAIPDRRLDALRLFACSAGAFGVAELVSQKSFVGKGGLGVFTKMKFKILDDWRSEAPDNKKMAQVIVLGGEAEWKGERFRIKNSAVHVKENARYVLIAGNRFTDKQEVLYGNVRLFEVVDNTLYSAPGWTPFPQGIPLAQAKADVAKALAMRGCK